MYINICCIIVHTCAYAILRENIKVNFQIQIVGKVEIWMICAFLFFINSSSVHLFHIIGAYGLVQSDVPFHYASFL